SDPQFRKSFEKNVEISRDNLTRFMRRKKINRLEVFTSGLWVKSLIGFFKSRQKGVFKYD
ncbi:MAG: hypothetical protein U9P44_01350, partial [archaeon]|nr:hypothetical protein [archaeon]